MVLPAPASPGAADPPQDGTTYFSVIDLEGNMVCATPSGGFLFRSVFFPELGFALSTRSETFFLEPGHPNVLQTRKAPSQYPRELYTIQEWPALPDCGLPWA